MKLKRGALDGAQPRDHVFAVLRRHGVTVTPLDEPDEFFLEGPDGNVEVLDILDPVLSDLVIHLWRAFSDGSWPVTELAWRPKKTN